MHEPAVALTDYALSIESVVLAALLWFKYGRAQRGGPGLLPARWFTLFVATISLPSLLAGTFHGFVEDDSTLPGMVLWRGVMLTIGVVAFVGANAAGTLWSPVVRKIVKGVMSLSFVAYCALIFLRSQEYLYAILIYLPASLFLLISFMFSYVRTRNRHLLLGATGMLLTFLAAGVQQSSLRFSGLDHNALYHIVQAIALVLVYLGALAAVEGQPSQTARSLTTTGGR